MSNKMPLMSFANSFLFEVSWEVCNKVGGIYTVIRTKLKEVEKNFGNRYILIGPLLDNNRHFVDDESLFAPEIIQKLKEKNLTCRFGYWDAEGSKPAVILVGFKDRYNLSVLLYNLWADFAVDSLASNYDFHEPILFSTAAGEVIEAINEALLRPKEQEVIAQFHEWMCGAGLLYLKKHSDDVATVFTTHATVLGRSLSSDGILIYNLPKNFDPTLEAKKHGVFAKHSMEHASAKEADCFTTVSNVTADEAYVMLGKYPDKAVFNGLDIERKQNLVNEGIFSETRMKLRQIASSMLGKLFSENTLLWITSGRYEFHNKGFDVLLKSLALLEKRLPKDAPPIIVFFLVAANWRTKEDSLLNKDPSTMPDQREAFGLATHRVYNPQYDSIIRACNELGLRDPSRKIHVIYSDAYLNGNDGVFDVIYEQVLASCDLSIFPSIYEPWGYTPLESIAYATPTITTDLAGFGDWINHIEKDHQDAVCVLPRKNKNDDEFILSLGDYLEHVIKISQDQSAIAAIRNKSLDVAKLADWQYFYEEYLYAYMQAIKFNEIFHAKFDVAGLGSQYITTIHEAESITPRFRQVQYECPLPDRLCKLRDLAYNFWWVWHENAKLLFQKIDPNLWEESKHNPVHFLNLVSSSALNKAANNDNYVKFYNAVLASFEDYSETTKIIPKFCGTNIISDEHPIAYFCMEYGIDECLPIYSGGLGILAGDYLKAMSDLHVPTIAIGLFYKQGYFLQNVNSKGEQVALYETWNTSEIPMRQLNDEAGKALLVGVEIASRTVYARVWEVKVGHVNLYLLDTDTSENTQDDRAITNSLYGGTRENRLKQEIILGIGGTRFILEKLKINPAIYHLNEGHSAFLLLERIKSYLHQGFTFNEAVELVRSSSIFTTHTPVPAGNEVFTVDLIKRYFTGYAESLGISIDKLLAIARDEEGSTKFSMTILSLRLTLHSNAVSTLHGKVAREMWKNVWRGLLEGEVPIDYVTNGVHLFTWLGSSLRELYDDYLAKDWDVRQDDQDVWRKINAISDNELWSAHQKQKAKLIALVKEIIPRQYALRKENKQLIADSINALHVDTLIIGLARRFTAYKRNDLILKDSERLARILTNEKRPIVMLIAGKAHPADGSGSDLIHEVIDAARNKGFKGHVIFLEEYNIALAKALVQGVDVWVNTPILGHEACGTSGMKAGINGTLNFSTKDGWWEEAYNENIGWEIASMVSITDADRRNDLENLFLLNTLENSIAALYYDKKKGGFSPAWVEKMKHSIALISGHYNTSRMVHEYIDKMYCSVILYANEITKDDYKNLKTLVAWKKDIVDRFTTVKIKSILINGIKDNKISGAGLVKIKLLLFSGKVTAREIKVELLLKKDEGKKFMEEPIIVPFKLTGGKDGGVLIYDAEYQMEDTGFYSYGVRLFPVHELLYREQDVGIVHWG